MSVYDSYTTIAKALAAFALGKCRRHVEVCGHVIDLVQAMAEEGRVREEPTGELMGSLSLLWSAPSGALVPITSLPTREEHDRTVAANVRNSLVGSYVRGVLAEEADRPKPAPVCPCCLRPEGPT